MDFSMFVLLFTHQIIMALLMDFKEFGDVQSKLWCRLCSCVLNSKLRVTVLRQVWPIPVGSACYCARNHHLQYESEIIPTVFAVSAKFWHILILPKHKVVLKV
jgi:hypothetical protein